MTVAVQPRAGRPQERPGPAAGGSTSSATAGSDSDWPGGRTGPSGPGRGGARDGHGVKLSPGPPTRRLRLSHTETRKSRPQGCPSSRPARAGADQWPPGRVGPARGPGLTRTNPAQQPGDGGPPSQAADPRAHRGGRAPWHWHSGWQPWPSESECP